MAVIECVPAVLNDVEIVAVPELRIPVPSVVVPSKNVTVPVAAAGDTVAVKVIAVLTVVLVAEAASVVVVAVVVVELEDAAVPLDPHPVMQGTARVKGSRHTRIKCKNSFRKTVPLEIDRSVFSDDRIPPKGLQPPINSLIGNALRSRVN